MYNKLESSAKFGVIGYGSWASAIVGLLNRNRVGANWHIRNAEVLEGLKKDGSNPKYISELEYDMEYIDLSERFSEPLTVGLSDKFVISAIKGIIDLTRAE